MGEADGEAVCDGELLGLDACEGEGSNIVHVINSPHYIEESLGFGVVLLTLCRTFSHTLSLSMRCLSVLVTNSPHDILCLKILALFTLYPKTR